MNIIAASERTRYENSENCIAFEYVFENETDINSAVIELTGRYPDKGFAVNSVCKEIIYVIEGKGRVCTTDLEKQLQEGDMIRLLPEEKYYFDGKMKMLISSSPAWYPSQYKNIR